MVMYPVQSTSVPEDCHVAPVVVNHPGQYANKISQFQRVDSLLPKAHSSAECQRTIIVTFVLKFAAAPNFQWGGGGGGGGGGGVSKKMQKHAT